MINEAPACIPSELIVHRFRKLIRKFVRAPSFGSLVKKNALRQSDVRASHLLRSAGSFVANGK